MLVAGNSCMGISASIANVREEACLPSPAVSIVVVGIACLLSVLLCVWSWGGVMANRWSHWPRLVVVVRALELVKRRKGLRRHRRWRRCSWWRSLESGVVVVSVLVL